MGLERFERLVEAFGADPRRWPQAERAAAEAFLAGNVDARARLVAAAEIDSLLSLASTPEPSDLLHRRVLRAAPRKAAITPLGWLSGAGWAAAAAAGVFVGVSIGQQVSQAWQADDILEQASAWSADEAEYYG